MNEPLSEFRKNDWVKVMMPNIVRRHCLAIVDTEFAHAHCGRSFAVSDLMRADERDGGQRCPSCAVRAARSRDENA